MRLEAPVLHTERLVLRPLRLSDFAPLRDLYQTDRARFIGGLLDERASWDGFMNTIGHWPALGFGGWAIELRTSGELIGEVALLHPPDYPETELGWLLHDGHEGHGYAYEAAIAARDFGFRTAGLTTLVSYIDPDNWRSIRLAERLGATRDIGAATPGGDPCLVFRHANP